MIKIPDGTLRILVQGLDRVRLAERVQDEPYLVGELAALPDVVPESPEVEALTRTVQQQFGQIIGLTPYLPEERSSRRRTSTTPARSAISSRPPCAS